MKIPYFITISLLIAAIACSPERQQAPRSQKSRSVEISHDLSNQRITGFAEDSAGRMWIATFRGFNRYNGHDFHQFTCTDDSIDLPHNQINDVFRDSRNRLWVSTISGIALYDNAQHFIRIPNDGDANLSSSQFFESRDKTVYAKTNNAITRYNEDTHRFETVIPNLGYATALCAFDRRNKLWVADTSILRGLHMSSDSVGFEATDSLALPGYFSTFYLDTDGDQLWMGGPGQLAIFDLRNRHFEQVPTTLAAHPKIAKAYITQIHPYEGGYWLFNTANSGLLAYNALTDQVISSDEPGFPFEVPEFRIDRLYTDSHKNLWVGSYDHGFAVINQYKKQFNNNAALEGFMHGHSIVSVDADSRGNIFATANLDGLYIFNPATSQARHISAHDISGSNSPLASVSLAKTTTNGDLWLASLMEGKVWRTRWDGNKLQVLRQYDIPMPHMMHESSNGTLWLGTGTRWLAKYDPNRDAFDFVDVCTDDNDQCFISGIAEGGDRFFLAAFDHPLLELAHTPEGAMSVDSVPVIGWEECIRRSTFIPTDMVYDSYGILWIGTVGNGLLRYDPETLQASVVEGMPCSDISAIVEDKLGHLWVSTQYGLARIDRTTGDVKCYYVSDGIGGNQYYDRATATMPDGTLLLGGTHGLTVFNPLDVGVKRSVPLAFDDFKMHNSPIDPAINPEILQHDLTAGDEIVLDHDQNGFSISFAALDYGSKEPPHYYYMLEGYDQYWIDARQSNEAYYGKLPPGNYTFKVRIGDDKSLSTQQIQMHVRIKGNPWRAWWAWCIYAVVGGALLIFLIARSLYHRQQENRMRQILELMEGKREREEEGEREKRKVKEEEERKGEEEGEREKRKGKEDGEREEKLSAADRVFMQDFQKLMEDELSNSELDITRLTERMHVSRSKLYYKIKSITGENPAVIFKTYKLNRAAELLKEGRYTVAEIADMTGFSTPAHFSTSFKKHFGVTPTEYSK